jgi:glucokinase
MQIKADTARNPEVLAIDIGGTFVKMGLVSSKGDIREVKVLKSQANDPYSIFEKRLSDQLQLYREITAENPPLAIGVGAPNASRREGAMINPPNFKWGSRVPLLTTITRLWDLPVFLTNDANAAALGERRFGQAKGMRDFVMLTLGTGLGSGIISQGQLLTGHNEMAGEIGHVNVYPKGRQCNCGLKGCLETYASVTGIKRTVFELLARENSDSVLKSYAFEDLDGKIISEAALKGDAIAREAFTYTGTVLGLKMADTAAHLDPEAFIISGGLSKAGNLLLDPVRKSLEASLFPVYRGKIKVLLSSYSSAEAVLGPAALAWDHLEHNG